MHNFMDSNWFAYGVVPLLIFLARVCDVTIGTVRLLTLSRGYKWVTAVLGFFEILIWLVAIGQVFKNLNNVLCYIAYAGGFATGNFVGMMIEERIALGSALIRLITNTEANELIAHLKKGRYRFTSIKAQGSTGDVHVLFMVIRRKSLKAIIDVINRFNPNAFYTVEDVRQVREGIVPVNPDLERHRHQT